MSRKNKLAPRHRVKRTVKAETVWVGRWHRDHVWQKQKTQKQLQKMQRDFWVQHSLVKKQTQQRIKKQLVLTNNWLAKKRFFVLLILFMLGYTLCISGWFYLLYQKTIVSFQVSPSVTFESGFRVPEPTTILLPSINKELPLVAGEIKEGIWETADDRPTFLNTSARPGEPGNIVIYGHNKQNIFGDLKKLSRGQTITLVNTYHQKFEYVIQSIEVVSPNEIDLVLPTETEVLTVYTCTGPFDSKRLVLRAIPLR